jgi:hypothetical protein
MSTLNVEGIKNSAATSNAITLSSDGECSAKLSNFGRRNIVINGNFNINQRATSANNANGIYTTDRWAHWFGNTSVTTWTQRVQDTTPGADAPAGEGHRKYFEVVKSDAGSVAANGYSNFQYHIEASDLACSGWDHKSATSYLTLSFWVRQSAASQTFYGQIRTANGTAQKYTFAFTADSTWRKVTVTIPGNSNITMNNDNGKGATIWIAQWMGTDYTTSGHTLDAWGAYSGSDQCPDMANGYLTSTAWFRIAGVQLEVGSAATPFDHRTDGEEFIRCQRYFQAFMSKPNEGHTFATRFTTQAQGGLTYFTNMRANPSSTLKGIRIHVMGTGANETVTSHNTTIAGGSDTRSSGMWALIVSGNLVQGQACLAHGLSTSSPMGMWLDAELS